jgi:hypothetical protein
MLQISAVRGDLQFSYKDESRIISQGKTYRIYLDSDAGPQRPAGGRAATSATTGTKIAIVIVAGAVAGATAWGIHDLIESSDGPESLAKA